MIRELALISLLLASPAAAQTVGPPSGGSPSGAAGGDLSGTYPNPTVIGTTDTAWTPSDASGASLTFSSVSARYTKVGKMVTAFTRLVFPVTANGSNVSIGGLPVAASANYSASSTAAGSCFFGGASNTVVIALIVQSGTSFNLINNAGAIVTNATLSGLGLSCVLNYVSA